MLIVQICRGKQRRLAKLYSLEVCLSDLPDLGVSCPRPLWRGPLSTKFTSPQRWKSVKLVAVRKSGPTHFLIFGGQPKPITVSRNPLEIE